MYRIRDEKNEYASRYSSRVRHKKKKEKVARNCISLHECRECYSNRESVTHNIEVKPWEIPRHLLCLGVRKTQQCYFSSLYLIDTTLKLENRKYAV